MVAGAEVIHPRISVLDMQRLCISRGVDEIVDLSAAVVSPSVSPNLCRHAPWGPGPAVLAKIGSTTEAELRTSDATSTITEEPSADEFVPSFRSGSFADIGPRRYMEDEHIRIDDLSAHLGSMFTCPLPSAFYGIFDGHGGPDAASYIKRHAIRFFFEDSDFPRASEVDNVFVDSVESSLQRAFLRADLALADECTVSSSSGTTALAALIFGRLLLVANVGDCRAVLCRKGEALEMSQDHRPIHAAELQRVVECGGYVDDGYLNGVLSVSRALGDWDIKLPQGLPSPLIAEPEFRQMALTEDDEFLVIGCDGIWDVMSSQHAVNIVKRGLLRHDDPERCARELVMEALRLNTFDNLTVIVICFDGEHGDAEQQRAPRLRSCRLSMEALCSLRSWLEKDDDTK